MRITSSMKVKDINVKCINQREQCFTFLQMSAPHWYIGQRTEKKVRSKGTNLTVIPLIQWEHLTNGQWTDLKVVNTNPNIPHAFTLNLTINHGDMIIQ